MNKVINNKFVLNIWEDEKHLTDVINDKYGTNYAPENLVVLKSTYTKKQFGNLDTNDYGICTYLNGKKNAVQIDGIIMQEHTLGNSNPFIFKEWKDVDELYFLHIRYV